MLMERILCLPISTTLQVLKSLPPGGLDQCPLDDVELLRMRLTAWFPCMFDAPINFREDAHSLLMKAKKLNVSRLNSALRGVAESHHRKKFINV